MIGWTVMVRGIRHRAGRSLLVLVLATLATASAVTAVAYLRAARASVLADTLTGAPAYATDIVLAADGPAGGDAAGGGASDGGGTSDSGAVPAVADVQASVRAALAADPGLAARVGQPVAAVDTDTLVRREGGFAAMARLSWRDGVCGQVTVTGRCPRAPGEVMVSARSAEQGHLAVGDHLTVRFAPASASGQGAAARPSKQLPVTLVGIYTPVDTAAAYWGARAYFVAGTDPTGVVADRMDAVFTGAESDVRTDPAAAVALRVDVPLRVDRVGVDDVATLRRAVGTFRVAAGGAALTVSSGLPQVLDAAAAGQRALDRGVPVVAVPLVLLCLFVLFLVVAALAEERAPEVALAKLRGLPPGRAARFGVAEVVALIVLAAPLGLLVGLALVEVAARVLLAPGVHAGFGWAVPVAALLAMLVGAGAAVLAARATLRRPVLAMLRRVPARSAWRAGVVEASVAVAAAAALVAALQDRSSTLALLSAPLLALLGGVAAARLLGLAATRQLRTSLAYGEVSGVITGARLSRRPGRLRVVIVVTVAIAVLVFGAATWDAGVRARDNAATDALGADRVYSVLAPYPSALVTAVGLADPGGNSMAVVRADQKYAGGEVSLVGVESLLLPRIAIWRGGPSGGIAALATALRPPTAPPIVAGGTLTVSYNVVSASGPGVSMSALLAAPGQPPATVEVDGHLAPGAQQRVVPLDGCAGGCRLLGFRLGPRDPGHGRVTADVRIASVQGSGEAVTDFSDANRWRGDTRDAPSATLDVSAGTTLEVKLSSAAVNAVLVAYRDTPDALPVVVAGRAPNDDPDAASFSFPGLGGDAQQFQVVARADRLPRSGANGLLFDLGDATEIAERNGTLADATGLRYEVWANASAPADLAARLAAQGIPVRDQDTIGAALDRLGRGAPTLGLWLYLFAGGLALLLAAGTALLGDALGADTRRYEVAALDLSGVSRRALRRAVLTEYGGTLGLAWLVGVAAGLIGATLMLPGITLVAPGDIAGAGGFDPASGPGGITGGGLVVAGTGAVALAVSLLALAAVVFAALRVTRRVTPDRLREGAR
ncbi:MAG TPA: FtsX-like permease family protein [Micromonosporaceae bacterium]|nr:FtsX-like permease family protein [Micromonosporaceae bacterium]